MTAQPLDDPPEYEPPDVGSIDALDYDLAGIRHGIARLSDDVPAALDVDDTTETVVKLLHEIRKERVALAEIEAFVEAAAAKRVDKKKSRVAGFIVEIGSGWKRARWHHPNLMRDVCADLIHDENGVVDEEAAHLLGLFRDKILGAAYISYWRAEDLRKLGLDPDDYSESLQNRRTVKLTPAVDEATS